ncbi:hypothetical protein DMP17_44510 [Pseudonocardia sp. TMWB2A]
MANLLAPMAGEGWDIQISHESIRAGAQDLVNRKPGLLVVDLTVVVDTEDLGWLRQILLWPRMPGTVLVARHRADHARAAAFRSVGNHLFVPCERNDADLLPTVQKMARYVTGTRGNRPSLDELRPSVTEIAQVVSRDQRGPRAARTAS